MSEEVKEKLFSEMGQDNVGWKRPEKMMVIARKGVSYPSYYNEKTQKFGPLLEATIYCDTEPATVENGVVKDYREIVGIK